MEHDDEPNTPTAFETRCCAVADAMEQAGARLRVTLTTNGTAEPFLISARYQIKSRMHVHPQREAEAAITDAIRPLGGTYREFLDVAVRNGRRLAKPHRPAPVVWNEPALIIAGIAPGTVALWRKRRNEAENTAETPR